MTGSLLVYFAIFCAGLVIGSQLGILLMCVLHTSAGCKRFCPDCYGEMIRTDLEVVDFEGCGYGVVGWICDCEPDPAFLKKRMLD